MCHVWVLGGSDTWATIKLNEQTLGSIKPPSDVAQAYYWEQEVPGFGVVVGRTGIRTFVARSRVNGQKVKTTIGIAGRVRDDGHEWTVKLARRKAKDVLAKMASGLNPNSGKNERRDTPRSAKAIGEMKDSGKREMSIKTVEHDVPRLLSAWMDRPLSDLTVETVQRIKEQQKKHKTQTNRLLAHISAIWNTTGARRSRGTTRSVASASRSSASIPSSRASRKNTCRNGCAASSSSRTRSGATSS